MAIKENEILAELWKKIVDELELTKALPTLVKRAVTGSKSTRYRSISDYNRNISAKEISFKTFVSLLFDLLRVKQIKFKVELLHHNGTVREHEIKIMEDINAHDVKVDLEDSKEEDKKSRNKE